MANKKQILEYWETKVCETELNLDWSEGLERCWNCADKERKRKSGMTSIEKCHIIPKSIGGPDTPENMVLLCDECHKEAPDCTNYNFMWEWIKSNRTSTGMYGTYRAEKGIALYEKMYSETVVESFIRVGVGVEDFSNWMNEQGKSKIGLHGGKVSASSYAGMIKQFINEQESVKQKT